MENFIAWNPTHLHFGRGVIEKLGKTVSQYGSKVLLVYGGGSIHRNGIYKQVMDQLRSINAEVYEYPGILPNPVVEDADAAARFGRKKGVDVVLAVGGGSAIDSAKVISVTIPVDHSAWDFFAGREKPKTAVPLIAVLTLAATGTEMNPFAVVQNNATKKKSGWGHDLMYPKHSFLDPQFTVTVPKDYTAYGIADLIIHCTEAYFGDGDATLSDRFVFSIIKEAVEYGPQLLNNPGDYQLRARIMYAATAALNQITLHGRKYGDWGVHQVGHVLSLLYGVPHGASLTIVLPAWMKYHKEEIPERIALLGKNVFGTNSADEAINAFESFFKNTECPVRLSDLNNSDINKKDILEVMESNKASGNVFKLTTPDYIALLNLFE